MLNQKNLEEEFDEDKFFLCVDEHTNMVIMRSKNYEFVIKALIITSNDGKLYITTSIKNNALTIFKRKDLEDGKEEEKTQS